MSLLAAAAGLTAGALGAAGLGRLREHQKAPRGLSDLLGWGFLVGEGVVLLKDGSFLAAWRVRGRDLASSTAAEVVNLAGHANAALAALGDGWMVHADAVRRDATGYAPPERCHFPDPVSRAIDGARRARYAAVGEHYETESVLSVTYTPPAGLASELQKRLVKGRDAASASEVWDRLVGQFERDLRGVRDRLSAAMRVERFGSVDLLRHLHECLTGLDHAVGVPRQGAYLDYALADQPFVGGFEPRVGSKHVRVVAVQGYPNATRPGLADPALRLPFPYRWSVRFLPLSPTTAVKAIGKAQLGWFQKRRGAGDWVKDLASKQKRETTELDLAFQDGNATAMVHDAGAARAANSGGEVRFGYLTVCAVVMADTRRIADERAATLLKAVRDLGFTGRIEDVNAVDAFLGSLPGHGHPNLRRPLLTTENVVDVLPLTAPWGGHREVPSQLFPPDSPPLLWAKTDGSTPFRLCLHEGDVGHTLVVGATGAGKSVLVGLLLAQWRRYAGARTVTFDVGYSHYVSGRAMGAAHYDLAGPLAAGRPVEMQPLRDVDRPEVRTWAVDWVESLVELQGQTLTPEERGRVAHAIGLLAENPPEGRTLTALLVNLGTERLRALVRPYTLEGAYGQLFDADRDSFGRGGDAVRHQVAELSHLVGMSDRVLVPALTYLFRRVEEGLDGSPTLIVIEEAWAALMHGRFADRLRQWLLTLRKRNAAVVVVAHSPAQFRDPGVKGAQLLVESCPTRIFLPNPDAVEAETAALYTWLGLNRAEVSRLAKARKKQDYYVRSPSGARMFDLALSPVELAFLATLPGQSADETVREAARLAATEGERWPAAWLRLCGLTAEADAMVDSPAPEVQRTTARAPSGPALRADRASATPVDVTPGPTRSAR
jgi:type IV secretion system protein VirB4